MRAIAQRWAAISDRTRVRIARGMVVGSAVLGVFSLVAYISAGEAGYFLMDGRLFEDWILHNVVLGAFGMSLLVWFAVPAQPRNGAVWALAWSSLFQGVNAGSNAWTLLASNSAGIDVRPETVPLGELPLSVGIPMQLASWSWIPGLVLLLTLVLLLLPDGKLLSRRWRPVAWLSVGSIAALSAAFFWIARPRDEALSFEAVDPPWLGPLFLPVLASVLASVAGLIIRYRRSTGEQRVQLRWIAWGGAVWGLSALTFPVAIEPDGADVFRVLSLVTGIAFLAALYVAITKHRLYDIDIVVSKTMAFALLVGLIGGLYFGVVYGFGSLVNSGDQISFDVQVIATVAVAIAFQPARRRAQAWANRVVYGQRVTPYEVLATFSHGAAEASDDELIKRIPRLIVDGTLASDATIWLESGDGFRAAGASHGDGGRSIPIGSGFEDRDADVSVPIFHDGELLGGLSLVIERGEELPPSEMELVEQLAAGLGLALRNASLTSRLRHQVAELEASRERILAAADEARRDLERDLDSGPQQQLVALKVKLGPTRMRAARLGAERTADVLAQLESDAGDAIQAVRDFSSGVFPPLLEAEGVVAAIRQRVRGATLAVRVSANGVGRYPGDVEAAAYFSILEALQNVAKYANASAAEVTISDDAGEFRFTVADEGDGFDTATAATGSGLANMADRLDAVGGSLEIESSPGAGTVVAGSIPVASSVLA